MNFKVVNIILLLLWAIALFSAMFLSNYMLESYIDSKTFIEANKTLLSAFFMLLAASIASASVMKSIDANKELKDREVAQTQLGQIIYLQNILLTLNKKCNALKRSITQVDDCENISELWEKVLVDKYFVFFLNYDAKEILEHYEAYDAIYSISNSIHNIQAEYVYNIELEIGNIITNIKILDNHLSTELEKIEKKMALIKPPNIPIMKLILEKKQDTKKEK